MKSYPDCEITDEGVILPVAFLTRTIAFRKIKSVQKVSFWKALSECMHVFKTPIFFNGGICSHYVLIETERFRFAVHPNDADKFVRIVSGRVTVSN